MTSWCNSSGLELFHVTCCSCMGRPCVSWVEELTMGPEGKDGVLPPDRLLFCFISSIGTRQRSVFSFFSRRLCNICVLYYVCLWRCSDAVRYILSLSLSLSLVSSNSLFFPGFHTLFFPNHCTLNAVHYLFPKVFSRSLVSRF